MLLSREWRSIHRDEKQAFRITVLIFRITVLMSGEPSTSIFFHRCKPNLVCDAMCLFKFEFGLTCYNYSNFLGKFQYLRHHIQLCSLWFSPLFFFDRSLNLWRDHDKSKVDLQVMGKKGLPLLQYPKVGWAMLRMPMVARRYIFFQCS